MDQKHDIDLTLDQMKTVADCLHRDITAAQRLITAIGKNQDAKWCARMSKRQALNAEAHALFIARIVEAESIAEDSDEQPEQGPIYPKTDEPHLA